MGAWELRVDGALESPRMRIACFGLQLPYFQNHLRAFRKNNTHQDSYWWSSGFQGFATILKEQDVNIVVINCSPSDYKTLFGAVETSLAIRKPLLVFPAEYSQEVPPELRTRYSIRLYSGFYSEPLDALPNTLNLWLRSSPTREHSCLG